ncbi:hypothetical protein GCM10009733_020730 [Nonomuraea maheshkhaliensis]|uniref:Lsr2 DNA-binding domain-containing protein n=1 Tax=Nonomuraea maheshkhaliensis TaxID=419590 RepID=A0ABP4QWD0_9ACTN
MTTALVTPPTKQPGITAAYARALLFLAQGHTPKDAAAATGVPFNRLVDLARKQGWAIHPTNQRATDSSRDDFTPVLDPELVALAATWTGQPRIIGSEDKQLSASELLAAAATCDDHKVRTALNSAMKALDKLRTAYNSVVEQEAAAAQHEAAKQAAAKRVADLKRELLAAREQAKALGASTTRASRGGDRGRDRRIREWAKTRGLPVSDRGQISRDIRAQYEAAHQQRTA